MARKRKKKGHARTLRRRYGRSTVGAGPIRMNVTGQLILDPEKLETAIEKAVEEAATVVPGMLHAAPDTLAPATLRESEDYLEQPDYSGYPDIPSHY
jgi:hypothetical protein